MELPSAAAAVRSVGVVTRNNGDLSLGDGVRRRTAALVGAGAGASDTDADD